MIFPAEYFRIADCIYQENVMLECLPDGLSIQLGDESDLVIAEAEATMLSCYVNDSSCTLIIAANDECIDGLYDTLELDDVSRHHEVIVQLAGDTTEIFKAIETTFSLIIDNLSESEYIDAMDAFLENSDPKLLMYPPPKDKVRSIQLNRCDYKTLTIGKPLNDVMIDFYLRYLQEERLSAEQQAQSYFFSSFFFNRLVSSGYSQVASWSKSVNLFEKDYIVVPINRDHRWLLAIICFPRSVTGENSEGNSKNACILLFDSLATDPCDDVAIYLRGYLTDEHQEKFKVDVDVNEHNMPLYEVTVPQQDNAYDSGLYMLQYAETFFKKPIEHYTSLDVLNEQLKDWFSEKEMQTKRGSIAKVISELVRKHQPKQLPMPHINVGDM